MHYAGFWKRFGAYLIDGVILYFATLIVFVVFFLVMGIAGGIELAGDESLYPSETSTGEVIFYMLSFIIPIFGTPWLYYTLFESSNMMGTPGKKILNLTVVDRDNKRISFGRANARYWSRIISHIILYIGYIMAGFTEKKQALHDKIADTYVLDQRMVDLERLRAEIMSRKQDSPYPPM